MMPPCGPGKLGDEIVPDIWFGEACTLHDLEYADPQAGDKKACDLRFYERLKSEASTAKTPFRRAVRRTLAWFYYQGVRWFGGLAFRNARREAD